VVYLYSFFFWRFGIVLVFGFLASLLKSNRMSRARLVYLSTLPSDPSYNEGYRCDYCMKYFDEGPLYHCTITGTDACVQCARRGGVVEDVVNANVCLRKVMFPEKVVFDEINAGLRRVVREESLEGLRESLASTVVLGFQCEENVVGVLLANGTNILGLLEGKSVAAGWVVQPGSAPLHDMLRSAFHERTSQYPSPTKVSATPIYPAHFASLFPWFAGVAAQVSSSVFESDAGKVNESPVFKNTTSQIPTFIATTSFPSESQTAGDRVLFLLSSDILHCFSFKENLEVVIEQNVTCGWKSGNKISNIQGSSLTKGTLDWVRAVLVHMCAN
jgi:hypothetical protein